MLSVLFWTLRVCAQETLYVPSVNYPSIQSAIDEADNGDTIIVSAGTYHENIDFLGKAVTVQSVDPNDSNAVETTIIDGGQPTDVNKASVVTFGSGEGADSVLTGFTITGGTGSWILVSWEFQGLRWNRCGGGVVCYNMSAPTISKNIFINNSAGQGGGVYIYGDPVNPNDPSDPPGHISPLILDNTFINNFAVSDHGFAPPDNDYPANDHGDGGAIVCFQGCDSIIKGNFIQGNYAYMYGGGIHLRQWSNGLLEDNHITGNDSRLGAGLHITYQSSPAVRANLIESNTATNLGGGGIYVYYLSNATIEHNTIRDNYSANGSGIAVKCSSNPTIRSNLIYNNLAGSAIACTGSLSWIHHNTIINNSLSTNIPRPAGIECVGPKCPTIENNIIASTSAGYGIYIHEVNSPVIRYNDFWRNEYGNYSPGINDANFIECNISVDPQFTDQLVHLNYSSPCIGAADPNFVPDTGETDFDGNARLVNTRTDIGADEAFAVWNLTSQRQYINIQPAVDDANANDIIVATRGRYFENLTIGPNSIQLRSLKPHNTDCIDETIIDGNSAALPAVTFTGAEDANCILKGFTITGANHSGPGGAIAGNGTLVTISFCRITANTAGSGGGIYDCDGEIANCRVSNNTSSGAGGGLNDCDGQMHDCFIFDNNAASDGGGLYDCNAVITNNTITNNNAVLAGGGLHSCRNTIANCIIRDNTAPDGADLKECCEPNHCCLETAGTGTGNIYADPDFIDPCNGNYHLTVYSDCIDAGDNNSVSQQSAGDIDNETRVFIFDPDKSGVVDIGADEVTNRIGDFNDDGTVDHCDLAAMLNEWLHAGQDLQTELTDDELVNFADYTLLADYWLWRAPWYSAEKESALKFDSTSDGHVLVHTPQGCILNNVYTFTYTAWVYPLGFSQINARIIGKNERALMTRPGGVLVGYSNGHKTAQSASGPGALQTGKWQFLSMTRSIETDYKIRLYIDGLEVSYQQEFVADSNSHPHPDWRAEGEWDLMFGSQAWCPGNNVPDAIIDEVAIYDRVLSQQEIEYLYNNGLGRPTASLNPIGLWHMDDNQGAIVTDSSGNGNDGLLQETAPPVWTNGKFLKY